MTTVSLEKGQSLSGFVINEDEESLSLRISGTLTQKISKEDINEQSSSSVSAMPGGLVSSLTYQELSDLIEFLAAKNLQ